MPARLVEAGRRWRTLMEWLADHGGLETTGCRVRQDMLADEVAIPRRTLVRLIRRMEDAGVLYVRRTTTDGAFGSPRGANIYRLLVSVDAWDERVEAIVNTKAQQSRRRAAALRAAQAREARPRSARRTTAAISYAPSGPELAVLIEGYDDDSLAGW